MFFPVIIEISVRALLFWSNSVVQLGIFLCEKFLCSAGLSRACLCGIWRAPRRALRFLEVFVLLRRGLGTTLSAVLMWMFRCARSLMLAVSGNQSWIAMDRDRGIVNSSKSCLIIIDRFRSFHFS